MYLIVTATEQEMQPVRDALRDLSGLAFLVVGMGPVETAVTLTCFLARQTELPRLVMNFGVAGAFPDAGLKIFDLVLAEREVFGDLGICYADAIEPFEPSLPITRELPMASEPVARAAALLAEQKMVCTTGTFVTVSCVSGTSQRGILLRDTHDAICENMEGAAVARVCREFKLPCLELRCISNLVEDRDLGRWRLREAGQRCGIAAASLVRALLGQETG